VRGLDGIAGQAQGAGEHVRGTAGHHTQHGDVALAAVREQTVHDLVDRAVTPVGDHEVDALLGRLRRRGHRVTPVVGLDNVQFHVAGQGVREHVPPGRRGRRRLRVHHQDCSHYRSLRQCVDDAVQHGYRSRGMG